MDLAKVAYILFIASNLYLETCAQIIGRCRSPNETQVTNFLNKRHPRQILFLNPEIDTLHPKFDASYEVVVLVSNNQLQNLSKSEDFIRQWIHMNIVNQLGHMNIISIAVGNGIATTDKAWLPLLSQTLKSIHHRLDELNLANQIKVSTIDLEFFGCLNISTKGHLLSLFDFLSSTGSYLILSGRIHCIFEAIHTTFTCMASSDYSDVPLLVAYDSRHTHEPYKANLVNAIFMYSHEMLLENRRALLEPSTTPKSTWCVAKPGIDDSTLQSALDYACGQGSADCKPIKFGGPCFLPNNVSFHASYVFNSYYQKNAKGAGTCSFSGAATVTTVDPSTSTCKFPSSGSLNETIMTIQSSNVDAQTNGLYVLLVLLTFGLLSNLSLLDWKSLAMLA